MPIYLIESIDPPIRLIVRAACEQCARSVAVDDARDESTAVWRDPARSTVTLVHERNFPKQVLMRVDKRVKAE